MKWWKINLNIINNYPKPLTHLVNGQRKHDSGSRINYCIVKKEKSQDVNFKNQIPNIFFKIFLNYEL